TLQPKSLAPGTPPFSSKTDHIYAYPGARGTFGVAAEPASLAQAQAQAQAGNSSSPGSTSQPALPLDFLFTNAETDAGGVQTVHSESGYEMLVNMSLDPNDLPDKNN